MDNDKRNLLQLFDVTLFLLCSPLSFCFSVDTSNPRILSSLQGPSHFGYQVCHFGTGGNGSVLVTDPLQGDGMGKVYRCFYGDGKCEMLPLSGDAGIALGLSLSCSSDRAVVCGPRLMRDCDSLRYLNGLCLELSPQLNLLRTVKPAFQECRFGLDAVILFDGSQSISRNDFSTMITFIKSVVNMFTDPRSQVAVVQFSTHISVAFHFENFAVDRNPESLMQGVEQLRGQTHTAAAVAFVLDRVLVEERGMRRNSRKLLVVITDGRSNDPMDKITDVIPIAERRGVTTRYAIGVGKDYSRAELMQIASSTENVFETDSFSALSSIRKQLQEKIFAIEGTQQSNLSSFQMELSQGGFSSAMGQDAVLFGAVGAFEWSGGLVEETKGSNSSFINASAQELHMKDSYLGYSVAVAQVNGSRLYFAGAPRYSHTGLVLAFQKNPENNSWMLVHRILGTQFGSYFGASLSVLGVSGLLLVGVPHYRHTAVGGQVCVYRLPVEHTHCSTFLRGSSGNDLGQFGAALSSCPDLNEDNFLELLVGAPQEDSGRGAIYLFLGKQEGVHTTYSQRIPGANVSPGLRYFGLSVHSSGDLSSDGLTDILVGTRGAAVVLRSRPLMCISASVALDPPVVPQESFHCVGSHGFGSPVTTATVCVSLVAVRSGNIRAALRAAVTVWMQLDDKGRKPRLQFLPQETLVWSGNVSQTTCFSVTITVPMCITDYSPVPLTAHFSALGLELDDTEGLKPILSPHCSPSFSHPVLLEQVCGEDQVCVSDLRVSLNVPSGTVVSSVGFVLDVQVEVSNAGEDASNVTFTLSHTPALSFSRASKAVGAVGLRCVSNRTDSVTHTLCHLGSAVLTRRTSMPVVVSLSVSHPELLVHTVTLGVFVTSDNDNDTTLQDNTASCSVGVRLPINVILINGDSTHFLTYPGQEMLQHVFRVKNVGGVAAPVDVRLVLPMEMTFGLRWGVSVATMLGKSFVGCTQANSTSDLEQFCRSISCSFIHCHVNQLDVNQPVSFTFNGSLTGDMKVTGKPLEVVSWGFVSFDLMQYAQFPGNGLHNLSIISQLEAPPSHHTGLVVGSVFAALVMLGVALGILYKIGCFKSKFHPEVQDADSTSPPSGGD